jgi:flagellar protein FliO/FliZ
MSNACGIGLQRRLGPGLPVTLGAGLLSAVSGAALAVEKGGAPAPIGASSLLQLIFGLLAVIAAIFATGFLLRRVGRFSSSAPGALRIVAGLSVGARERVVVVQVGEQQLLLGVAPGRVQTLYMLPQPLAPMSGSASGGGDNFAERLAGLMKRGQQK